jgi:hypothetical protein
VPSKRQRASQVSLREAAVADARQVQRRGRGGCSSRTLTAVLDLGAQEDDNPARCKLGDETPSPVFEVGSRQARPDLVWRKQVRVRERRRLAPARRLEGRGRRGRCS